VLLGGTLVVRFRNYDRAATSRLTRVGIRFYLALLGLNNHSDPVMITSHDRRIRSRMHSALSLQLIRMLRYAVTEGKNGPATAAGGEKKTPIGIDSERVLHQIQIPSDRRFAKIW
jgi:hypothetical protein